MAIVAAGKVFADVVNDNVNTYYSDPEWNAALGMGEKYSVEIRAQNVITAGTVAVTLEGSNDGIAWVFRATLISNGTLLAANATVPIHGSDAATPTVGGRYARLTIKLTTTTGAYVELWATARNAF